MSTWQESDRQYIRRKRKLKGRDESVAAKVHVKKDGGKEQKKNFLKESMCTLEKSE